jgi:hypothetical protein
MPSKRVVSLILLTLLETGPTPANAQWTEGGVPISRIGYPHAPVRVPDATEARSCAGKPRGAIVAWLGGRIVDLNTESRRVPDDVLEPRMA